MANALFALHRYRLRFCSNMLIMRIFQVPHLQNKLLWKKIEVKMLADLRPAKARVRLCPPKRDKMRSVHLWKTRKKNQEAKHFVYASLTEPRLIFSPLRTHAAHG